MPFTKVATSPSSTRRHPSCIPGCLESFGETRFSVAEVSLSLGELFERFFNGDGRGRGGLEVATDVEVPAVVFDLGVCNEGNGNRVVAVGRGVGVRSGDGVDVVGSELVLVASLLKPRRSVHE